MLADDHGINIRKMDIQKGANKMKLRAWHKLYRTMKGDLNTQG